MTGMTGKTPDCDRLANPPRACLGEGDRRPKAGGGGALRPGAEDSVIAAFRAARAPPPLLHNDWVELPPAIPTLCGAQGDPFIPLPEQARGGMGTTAYQPIACHSRRRRTLNSR